MGEWSRLPRSSLVVAGPFLERACFLLPGHLLSFAWPIDPGRKCASLTLRPLTKNACSDCKRLICREMSVDWQITFVRPFWPHRFMDESADDLRLGFIADRHQVNIPPIFWIDERACDDAIVHY
jgi:hypothetical protein